MRCSFISRVLIPSSILLFSFAHWHCQSGPATRPDEINVSRVVIYQNGIGYFERHGHVDEQMLKLRILPQQIGDVLKSLTVVDMTTGRPVNVALPVDKGRARQLADLPEQVRNGGGLNAIAQAFRGARATVVANDGVAEGRLIGVERGGTPEEERLTVLRDDGAMQTFGLKEIRELQINDRSLEVGLRKALDVSLDQASWKPMELNVHLAGKAPHELLISYVVEMPTWKPAYRIILEKNKDQGLLQGWAVVDNVSGEDWDQVKLSLTAGTPLTFAYDLYTPRFVKRPDLSPPEEMMAVAPPPPTGGTMSADEELKEQEAPAAMAREYASKSESADRLEMKKAKKAMPQASRSYDYNSARGAAAPSAAPPPPAPVMTAEMMQNNFRALVAGARVGSLFRYDIQEPVTIKDRQSALVSILQQRVPAEDVLLFRLDSNATNPYRAVRLTNTTSYMIEKGPVAIYKDNSFVGEAVSDKVEAQTSSFIPYSIDNRVIISLEDRQQNAGARLVKISRGLLTCEMKQVSVHKYTIYNSTGEATTIYVQRPHRTGWKLVQPNKGVMVEKEYYFAPIQLKASGKTEFEVREESPVRREVSLYSAEARQAIGLYLNDAAAEPQVRAALKEALELQEKLGQIEEKISLLERNKTKFSERQDQVRDNLRLLGKNIQNADLAKKLTTTLTELEKQLNEVTRELVSLDMKRSEIRDRLTVILKSITLEVK